MKSQLNRRTVLKTGGVSLSLPMLDAMNSAAADDSTKAPQRMVLICTTLGLHAPSLWPTTLGADYESTEYLSLLADHRADMTLFSGLCHESQSGRRPHDSEVTWLTAAQNPGFPGFRNSVSVDQFAAQKLGRITRFPSITLASNNMASQSFNSQGVMIPAQTSPADLFSSLFLQGTAEGTARQRQKLQDGRSILDGLGTELNRIRTTVSSSDIDMLDEYLAAVRQAEKNITEAGGWLDRPKPIVTREAPTDVENNADLIGRVQLLMDLIPLILQTDSTRLITVMIQDHNVVPMIAGVEGNHHNLSHHGQDADKIRQLQIVESELLKCFGGLLSQLKSTREQSGHLLQNTSVLFGSNLGNANMHNTRNLPVIVAGGGFSHGRYVAAPDNTPLSNLFLTMLHRMGVEAESFGQSTSLFSW
ncbi:MAG: DUF1552 domain-containing protein [Planctomycetaceae bacterium]